MFSILSLVTRFYLRGTQIGVSTLRSHIQWDEGPEHYSQWSGGQKTRRVNAALIRATTLCVVSGCSVFYQMLGARVWGWIPPPSSTLLWSFAHNDILLWVIPGCNQLRGRPRTDCSCSAGLCLVSLTLSKADHAIPSTPPAGLYVYHIVCLHTATCTFLAQALHVSLLLLLRLCHCRCFLHETKWARMNDCV